MNLKLIFRVRMSRCCVIGKSVNQCLYSIVTRFRVIPHIFVTDFPMPLSMGQMQSFIGIIIFSFDKWILYQCTVQILLTFLIFIFKIS